MQIKYIANKACTINNVALCAGDELKMNWYLDHRLDFKELNEFARVMNEGKCILEPPNYRPNDTMEWDADIYLASKIAELEMAAVKVSDAKQTLNRIWMMHHKHKGIRLENHNKILEQRFIDAKDELCDIKNGFWYKLRFILNNYSMTIGLGVFTGGCIMLALHLLRNR